MRLDQRTRFIEYANDHRTGAAVELCITNRVFGAAIPKPAKRQRIADQIKTALITARPNLILAANGARWHPNDPYRIGCFRRGISKAPAYEAIQYLLRIMNAQAIEQPVFQELMRTPRMKEILKQTYPGVIKLREYAGFAGSRSRKHRMPN